MKILNAELRKKTIENRTLYQIVDDIVKFKKIPSHLKVGRTASHQLSDPIIVRISGKEYEINSLKIKGSGLFDHLGNYQPPSTEPYNRIHPHIGFTRDGELIHIKSDPAPLGGIVYEKALNEYTFAHHLTSNNCPTIIPLYVYEYNEPSLLFSVNGYDSHALGVVISGYPDKNLLRFNTILLYSNAKPEEKQQIDHLAMKLGFIDENKNLSVAAKILKLYGKSLRLFHSNGFYRYSGATDNYAYSELTNDVILIDLDTSRRIEECSEIEKPLQLIRDVVSGLYGITFYILRKENIANYSPSVFNPYNLLKSLLLGYFVDVPTEEINYESEKIEIHYSQIYKDALVAHESKSNENSSSDVTDDFRKYWHQTFKQYWIDRDKTLCFYMAIVFQLYQKSESAKKLPLLYSQEKLFEYIIDYASLDVCNYVRGYFK